jgi:lipopolysaccharide transport system permease protein
MEMGVYVLVFGIFLGIKTTVIPYPLHVYSGIIVWIFFQNSAVRGSSSLVGNRALMDKVYFPRLIMPLVQIGANALDMLMAALLVLALIAYYWLVGPLVFGREAFVPDPGWAVLLFPVFVLMLMAFVVGFSLLMAVWQLHSADIGLMLPVLLRLGMYMTPVLYPLSRVPTDYQSIYLLNPMAVILEGLRWTMFGTAAPPMGYVLWAAGASTALLVWGLWAFRQTERTIVDVL